MALDLALIKMGLPPAGASRNDMQAAGCPSVALTYGYNYGETIALKHPDRVLACLTDLLPTLGLSFLKNQEVLA